MAEKFDNYVNLIIKAGPDKVKEAAAKVGIADVSEIASGDPEKVRAWREKTKQPVPIALRMALSGRELPAKMVERLSK